MAGMSGTLVKRKQGYQGDNAANVKGMTLLVDEQGSQQEIVKEEENQKGGKLLPDVEQLVPAKAVNVAAHDSDVHAEQGGYEENAP